MDYQRINTFSTAVRKPAIFFCLVAINVLLVVPLFIVTVILTDRLQNEKDACSPSPEPDNLTMKAEYRRYCFRSSSERGCLDRGFDLKQENNQTVCCGNSNEHVYSLLSEEITQLMRTDAGRARRLNTVKKYIARVQSDPQAARFRPAAHVGILQNEITTETDSGAPRIRWEKSGDRTFVSGDIIHGGDRLTVTTPGYYFVYTGLQYTVNPDTMESHAIVAYLFRNVNGTRDTQRKLMTARESSCKATRGGQHGPVSLYMAGLYLLRKGDEVSVRAYSHRLLTRSSATSYMGLYMV
ncbi:uncharacterized protein LOC143289259 [Babylonia areolata]|uniref:uncharacterized protein LOC143289259 n=1 Tax=Babylonia areolata TaxID=304850 RepID=UPI003FD1A73D